MQSLALPWKDILPGSRLDEILEEEKITYRSRVYTPVITLWAMLSQVLDPDKSLRNAVKRMNTWPWRQVLNVPREIRELTAKPANVYQKYCYSV